MSKQWTIRLKIATLSKELAETKWYQFGKRNKIYRQAEKLAKQHNIEF